MSTARPLFQPEPPSEPTPPGRSTHHLWVRVLAWTAGSILLLLLLVGITVTALLNSTRFHGYLLGKIDSIASDSLGTQVHLQNFALHLSDLSLDVYGLTVHGAAPYPDPPILQLQHAQVGVRIVSILHKKWYLDNVRVDRPIVQVFVDKDGNSNIPKPKSSSSKSKSNTTIFDLGVRHALLDGGEIYYNAQKSVLTADLHDLNFQASFNPPQDMYSGTLGYTDGRVVFGAYKPFEHNFDAQFDLTPSTFQLHHATLSSGNTNVNLAATAQNFSAPVVQAQYSIAIDGGQMAKLLNNPSVPAGMIRASGTAHYQQVANQPALQTLTLNGDLKSSQLLVKTSSSRQWRCHPPRLPRARARRRDHRQGHHEEPRRQLALGLRREHTRSLARRGHAPGWSEGR